MGKLGLTRHSGCTTPVAEERTTLIVSGGSQWLARVLQHDVSGLIIPANLYHLFRRNLYHFG
jgi:hypothetical protein